MTQGAVAAVSRLMLLRDRTWVSERPCRCVHRAIVGSNAGRCGEWQYDVGETLEVPVPQTECLQRIVRLTKIRGVGAEATLGRGDMLDNPIIQIGRAHV